MFEDVVSDLMRGHLQRLVADGKRVDGRALEEQRPIHLERGVAGNAEGSARVKLGNTDVIVGVKMDLGTPYPDTPDSGVLATSVELRPMASPTFEAGPPREGAVELARVVDRGIRESQAVDTSKLVEVPGESVWVLFLDIHVLDYDGNLFDAASYGALAALTNTIVPASKKLEDREDFPLPVEHRPISLTCAKIQDTLLVDPCLDEELIADARLTVVTDENGDIRAMQKGLAGSFTREEVSRIVSLSSEIGAKIRSTIVA
jgi:exosome complex component RRP42